MASWRKTYGGDASGFLRAEDLGGKPHVLRIKAVREHTFEDGKSQLILDFTNAEKSLGLNRTNAQSVAGLAKDEDTEQWPGTDIKVFPCYTEFGNKVVECVRICPTTARAPVGMLETRNGFIDYKHPAPLPPEAQYGTEDEVPF